MGLRWCWYNTMPAEVHFLVIHTGLSFEKIVQKEISFQWFSKMYTTDNSSFALAVGWSSMLIDYRVCEEKSKKPNTLSASENHWKSNCWEQEKKLEIFEIKKICVLLSIIWWSTAILSEEESEGRFFWDQSQDMSSSGFPPKKQASDWLTYLVYQNSCPESDLWKNWI